MNFTDVDVTKLNKADKILLIGEYGRLVKYLTGVVRDLKKDKDKVISERNFIQVIIPLTIEENKRGENLSLENVFTPDEPIDIHKFGIKKEYETDFLDWLCAYHEQLLTRYKDKIEKIAKMI